jgi:hypothetical protein
MAMPLQLPDEIKVMLPEGALEPPDVLRGVAAQIPGLLGEAVQVSVSSKTLVDRVVYSSLVVFRVGIQMTTPVQLYSAVGAPYPVYVQAACFGDAWPPPPALAARSLVEDRPGGEHA